MKILKSSGGPKLSLRKLECRLEIGIRKNRFNKLDEMKNSNPV